MAPVTAPAARLYLDGLSTAEVAERLGVHRETVRLRLKRAGIPRRETSGGRPLPPEDDFDVAVLKYLAWASWADVGAALGITAGAAMARFRRRGMTRSERPLHRHGTRGRYIDGCRCRHCIQANTVAAGRNRRARRGA